MGAYAVVLAGGGGTRLWPLSSPERPKPFLPLLPDGRSLLRRTVDRLGGLVAVADVHVVTDRRYVHLVRAQLPDVPEANVIAEPLGRNTAAAIALATVAIDRPDGDVMLVLPADHLVGQEGDFRGVLGAAAEVASRPGGALLTLGIEPTRAAVEYGYIVASRAPDAREEEEGLAVYRVDRFVEKPDAGTAAKLLEPGGPQTSWNAGIFVWCRGAIRAALAVHAPDILDIVAGGWKADRAGAPGALAAAYDAVRRTSIDYAVMEDAAASGVVRVVQAGGIGWSDLGGWTALLDALGATGVGRVVQAGAPAEVGADDLVLGRVQGRLELSDGPAHGILDALGPTAVLASARADRPKVEALVERVTRAEEGT